MGLVFAIGAVIGVLNCMLCAVLFKQFNLGLFWNTAIGVVVGGIGAVALSTAFPKFDFVHVIIAAVCVLVMAVVAGILNHRAR